MFKIAKKRRTRRDPSVGTKLTPQQNAKLNNAAQHDEQHN